MSFFKENSKLFTAGAIGIAIGAGLYLLLTRRNASKETILGVVPLEEDKPSDFNTLLKFLQEKLATREKTDDLLIEIGDNLFSYIWRRTKSIDNDLQTSAFNNLKKMEFSAYINQLVNDIKFNEEQKKILQRQADNLINSLGLSIQQINKATETMTKEHQNQNNGLKENINLAKEYFDAKVKIASREGIKLTKQLKEINWNEQNSPYIIQLVKIIIDAETFNSNNDFLTKNLELEMTIQIFEEQFKTQKAKWDGLLEPIYLELPFKPAFLNIS